MQGGGSATPGGWDRRIGIEVRTSGRVRRVRAHLVWSTETRVPFRIPAATATPPIVPRLSWGADESIRRAPPVFADQVRFSVVHHTAGRNDYSRGEAAAIVKGIQLYHVQGNGWNDIGYNFLVDRFGTIYEGRFGGSERNVVGAHAQGFNTGSVGIALLGTYGNTAPSRAAQDAIAALVSWRLDLAHVDPTAALTFVSGGSNRFPSGVPVLLRGVSGHRDTGFTECPGNQLYGRLNSLALTAGLLGGPKIYEPRVESGEGFVRFRARLSSSQPWVVVVTDAARVEVARGSGTGTTVDWTWDSLLAPGGRYTWTIRSGSARPASGPFRIRGVSVPLGIQEIATAPEAITPNGDGQGDAATLSYRLTVAANVTVEVVDAGGVTVATAVDRVWTRPGKHDGDRRRRESPRRDVRLLVRARTPAGLEVEKTTPLRVSRTLGLVSVTPTLFSPNRDGRNDRLQVGFSLTAPAEVSVRIFRDGRWVASPHAASYEAGAHSFEWNGVRALGPAARRLLRGGGGGLRCRRRRDLGCGAVHVGHDCATCAAPLGPRNPHRGQRARDPLPDDRRCSEGARGEARRRRSHPVERSGKTGPRRRQRRCRQYEQARRPRQGSVSTRRVDSLS